MKPPKTRNGPGGVAAPTRAENDQKAAEDTQTIARVPLNFERNRVPSAFASQFPPDGKARGCWWIAYRCPHCEASHLGRSPHRIETGLRRSRCGKRIWLVIARTYRGRFEVSA